MQKGDYSQLKRPFPLLANVICTPLLIKSGKRLWCSDQFGCVWRAAKRVHPNERFYAHYTLRNAWIPRYGLLNTPVERAAGPICPRIQRIIHVPAINNMAAAAAAAAAEYRWHVVGAVRGKMSNGNWKTCNTKVSARKGRWVESIMQQKCKKIAIQKSRSLFKQAGGGG